MSMVVVGVDSLVLTAVWAASAVNDPVEDQVVKAEPSPDWPEQLVDWVSEFWPILASVGGDTAVIRSTVGMVAR